jgi:hypothetical protein
MKQVAAFIIILLLCSCNQGHSQNKTIKKVADELNTLTDSYASILPFQIEKIALKNYGLTYKDFLKDSEDISYTESFSTSKDSIESSTLQEFYNGKIKQKLEELTSHKDFSKADIKMLVHIFACKSDDGKIYNFVYDENTGGSYQSRISYIYYAGQKEKQNQELYNPDGYHTIVSLPSKTGMRYLLLGQVVGCNTCQGCYARLVHYANGKPVFDFEYDLNTRIGSDNMIEYNPEDKTLAVQYFTDDFRPYCYCLDSQKDLANEDSDENTMHRCSCKFKFNGSTFVLADSSDRIAKPMDED